MFKKKALLTCLTSLLLLSGCNKLTQENYNKLKMGMERSEVESLFGRPDNCQNVTIMVTGTNCIWSKGDSSLKIQFVDNKVATYFANNLK